MQTNSESHLLNLLRQALPILEIKEEMDESARPFDDIEACAIEGDIMDKDDFDQRRKRRLLIEEIKEIISK